jgi:hypothetical protein
MSYGIRLRDRVFFLPADKKPQALAAIKALRGRETYRDSRPHFSWIGDDYLAATCLEDALRCWGFSSEVNGNGDIISLSYEWEKAGDEEFYSPRSPPSSKPEAI